MGTKALFLVNTLSRRGDISRAEIIQYLRAQGLQILDPGVNAVRDFEGLVRKHQKEVDLVIVGGGDGTLNAVSDVLVETKLPLGIIPLGTANDLARTLNLPVVWEEACDVIVKGKQKKLDLGWVNGKHFFNAASIGLSVQVTKDLNRELKKKWGVFAYVVATIRTLWRSSPFHVNVESGDEKVRLKTVQLVVANGRFYGGGMTVATDSSIDDQRLDFLSVEVHKWWQLALLVPALRRGTAGTADRGKKVKCMRGQEFKVTTRKPRSVNTDGELTTKTPAVFKVVPNAVTVFVP